MTERRSLLDPLPPPLLPPSSVPPPPAAISRLPPPPMVPIGMGSPVITPSTEQVTDRLTSLSRSSLPPPPGPQIPSIIPRPKEAGIFVLLNQREMELELANNAVNFILNKVQEFLAHNAFLPQTVKLDTWVAYRKDLVSYSPSDLLGELLVVADAVELHLRQLGWKVQVQLKPKKWWELWRSGHELTFQDRS